MAGGRYVVLGLASARSAWFRDVAQWANSSAVAVEFVKCVSAEEVRARLAGGRPFSALLAESSLPSLDRDLVEVAQQAGCAVIVVDDRRGGRDWVGLGANAALAGGFTRKELVDALASHTVMIGRADRVRSPETDGGESWRAPLVAVCGPGGTGASTVSIALAQGLAKDVRARGSVVLADLARRGEQAMLHDAADVVPGVQELVEAYRSGELRLDEIRATTFAVEERGYRLLLGLRRQRAWAAIRPRAFAAALDGLRQAFRIVVADTDADLEGEEDGGSIDVEERHTMTRTAIADADVVVVVGVPGLKGMHSLVALIGEILNFGVPSERVVPVVNRAPRSSRARSTLTSTLEELLPSWAGAGLASPLFLPDRRVDEALRDGVALPDALADPLAHRLTAVMERADDEARRPDGPQLVERGSLTTWSEQ
jgi:MinD-like ATPase involved in chromosome partitioning or flagellar assembly